MQNYYVNNLYNIICTYIYIYMYTYELDAQYDILIHGGCYTQLY